MTSRLLRFTGATHRDPAVERWLKARPGDLGAIARRWYGEIRLCGDEVRELIHDGCPTACLGDAGFAYVNVFTAHVNVGFFQGASLRDPARLLQGSGTFMRHIKLRPGEPSNDQAIAALIEAAYADMKHRIEHGEAG